MQTRTTYYTLDTKKLDDALAILDTELEALKFYAQIVREVNSGWSSIIGYISLVGMIVIAIPLNHEWISWKMALQSLAALYVVLLLVGFLSGFRSIREFLRLRRLQRNLGLARIGWFVGWKEFGARLLRLLPACLGQLICTILLFFSLMDFHPWKADVGFVSLVLGWIVSMRLLTSRMPLPVQKRMEENERLRSRLMSSQKSSAGFGTDQTLSIPKAEYKQIA